MFALKIFLEYQVNVPYQISLLYSGSKGMRPGWVINWCSCAEHFTFTVHLSTQEYKEVHANCYATLNGMLGGTVVIDWHPIPTGVVVFLVMSCKGNQLTPA